MNTVFRATCFALLLTVAGAPVAVAAGSPADQQTAGRDAPPPPPPDPAEVPPPLDRDSFQAWRLSGGTSANYESDVDFNGTRENGHWSETLFASLSRQWALRRGSINAAGNVGYVSYPGRSDLNQLGYGLTGSASYAATRRLSFSMADSLASSYAQDSRLLIRTGQLFPRSTVLSNASTVSTSYVVSRRSQAGASLSTTAVLFDEGSFADRTNVSANANFSTQVHRSHSVGVAAGYMMADGDTGDVKTLMGTWQASVGRTGRATASSGVIAHTPAGEGGARYSFGGSASITTTLARYHAVGATYSSQVEPAYGTTGTYMTHRLAASHATAVGPLTVSSAAGYSRHRDIANEAVLRTDRTLSFNVGYAIVSQLFLNAGYDLSTRTATAEQDITTWRVVISLSYGLSW